MSEAMTYGARHERELTAAAAVASGEVHQMPDGRAGISQRLNAATAGELVGYVTEGVFTFAKTAGIVLLDGGRAYWDHSANSVTFEPNNDRDFFLGTIVGDATSAATAAKVNLNVAPVYEIELGKGNWTQADTAGLGTLPKPGSMAIRGAFDAVAEIARSSILSDRSFAIGAKAILEGRINIVGNGDDAALDISIGIANAGHATDADSITESCFIHIDGNVLNILAESDDDTTEVSATDTTVDYAEGTEFEFWIDMRNPADIQIYIDGVLVLSGSTFRLDAASGPLKALFHMEKSSNDTVAVVDVVLLQVRTAEV